MLYDIECMLCILIHFCDAHLYAHMYGYKSLKMQMHIAERKIGTQSSNGLHGQTKYVVTRGSCQLNRQS